MAKSPYGYRWQQARVHFLRAHPLCRMCEARGKLTAASVVDHVIPHKGDVSRFWDEDNWQALCKPCHDAGKQSQDRTGRIRGCDANGYPLDPNHPWNRADPQGGE